MDLLAQIPLIGGTLAVLVPFLAVLSIVVFVHEYGHYIVGRWCGIKAEVFSVGFGKPLLKWTDRRGTRWQVAAVPLGGYVRFVGDMNPASAGQADDDSLTPEDRKVAFHNAGLLRRTATVAAGPFANFLLSAVIFTLIVLSFGQASNEPVIGSLSAEPPPDVGFQPGDRVLSIAGQSVASYSDIIDIVVASDGGLQPAVVERGGDTLQILTRYFSVPLVTGTDPNMPAAQAGLRQGDLILTIDGAPVSSSRELMIITAAKPPGIALEVEVERAGRPLIFRFVPKMVEREHPVTNETTMVPTMGISLMVRAEIEPLRESVPIHLAVGSGIAETWRIISGTLVYIHDMLFAGADTSQLGGPIRIAEISGAAAEQGISSLVWLIAVLSTSIGLINLFPIPILDGGHLMFYLVEALRGRPVGEVWMKVGTMIGLSLVLLLMVFATYNDLVRL